jgi:hypothetical protein
VPDAHRVPNLLTHVDPNPESEPDRRQQPGHRWRVDADADPGAHEHTRADEDPRADPKALRRIRR